MLDTRLLLGSGQEAESWSRRCRDPCVSQKEWDAWTLPVTGGVNRAWTEEEQSRGRHSDLTSEDLRSGTHGVITALCLEVALPLVFPSCHLGLSQELRAALWHQDSTTSDWRAQHKVLRSCGKDTGSHGPGMNWFEDFL